MAKIRAIGQAAISSSSGDPKAFNQTFQELIKLEFAESDLGKNEMDKIVKMLEEESKIAYQISIPEWAKSKEQPSSKKYVFKRR